MSETLIIPEQLAVIFMGSASDATHVDQITQALDRFGIRHEERIASAHKTPEYLFNLLQEYTQWADETLEQARARREVVIIAVAGRSNALGGCIDTHSRFPVINCPPEGQPDHMIWSSLDMPSGVGAVTVIHPQAAAFAAAKIFALSNPELTDRIIAYQNGNRAQIIAADDRLQKNIISKIE